MAIEFTVSDVARRLGVSPGTIRNYSRQFAEFLSPGASPPRGQTRQFSMADAHIFVFAQRLLAKGATYDGVRIQLKLGIYLKEPMEVPPLPEPGPKKMESVPADSIQLIIQPYIEEANRLRRERDEALARIAELERELGRLEGQLEVIP